MSGNQDLWLRLAHVVYVAGAIHFLLCTSRNLALGKLKGWLLSFTTVIASLSMQVRLSAVTPVQTFTGKIILGHSVCFAEPSSTEFPGMTRYQYLETFILTVL